MISSPAADALLKGAGLHVTRQRRTVVEQLIGRARPVSAQTLHEELQVHGNHLGLSTVYRTLNALTDSGLVHGFEHHGETAYRLCGSSHHHHLICLICGSVTEGPPVPGLDLWLQRLKAAHDFLTERHHVEVHGFCGTCHPARHLG